MNKQNAFRVRVCVILEPPESIEDEYGNRTTAIGYYRVFTVICGSEADARKAIEEEVDDGKIEWEDSAVDKVEAVQTTVVPLTCGISYRSGRGYFCNE